LTSETTGIQSIAFSPGGQLLASGGKGAVQLWDVHSVPGYDTGA